MNPGSISRSISIVIIVLAAASGGGATAQYTTEPVAEPTRLEARWAATRADETEAWGVDGVDPLHEIDGEWLYEVISTSDARFDGEVTYAYNNDRYRSLDLQVHHSEFHLTNDEGSWHERPAAMLGYPDLRPSTRTGVFDGAGAYDGLVAVAQLTWDPSAQTWDVDGFVIAGGYPPLPGEASRPD